MSPVARKVGSKLKKCNINAHLIYDDYDEQCFGNSISVFDIGFILLRFTNDRGQVFVDLSSKLKPDVHIDIDDIYVFLGKTTIEAILGRKKTPSLCDNIILFSESIKEITQYFSEELLFSTLEALNKIESERFRLRKKQLSQ